nr:probable oligoribonuclease [Megalopta genalis]XP_033328963.1 probable oligoribonuclease [Megalopta genalis]XP_033328964.1 probable oligoribonuclease [Megalopta genalis]
MAGYEDTYIVWIDTELTGLDIEKDTILEIACLITNKDLNIISKEFNVIINQSDETLNTMNEWCIKHHAETGLTNDSRLSKISLKEAEKMLLDFLKTYILKGVCPLAGNTIYMDRMFLNKHMPLINAYLHYRIIDVSTIKELARRWCPATYQNVPNKQQCHRALADIRESIQELKYYKEHIFTRSFIFSL